MNSPCYQCNDRKPYCHNTETCTLWDNYQKEMKRIRAKKYEYSGMYASPKSYRFKINGR